MITGGRFHSTGKEEIPVNMQNGHLPQARHAKQKSKKGSFCQQLIAGLDAPNMHATKNNKLQKRKRTPTPPILKLPTEIRQQILYITIDDDVLLTTDLDREAQRLSTVCATFGNEMTWVMDQWILQREKLRVLRNLTCTKLHG